MKPLFAASILFLCLSACGKLNFDPQPVVGDDFSPNSISGLSFWLRADQGVSTDPSNDNVTSWVESISGTMSFIAPLGFGTVTPPVFSASNVNFGGRPTVGFGVSSGSALKHLQVDSANVPALCDGTYTMFAVIRPNMVVDGINTYSYLNFTSMNNTLARAAVSYNTAAPPGHNFTYDLTDFSSPQKWVYAFNSTLARFSTGVVAMGAVFSVSGGATTLFRDGLTNVLPNSSSLSYTGGCSTVTAKVGFLSNSTGVLASTLDIAELMIYDWPLGATELNALGCYAKKKYGIPGYTGTCN